MPDDGAIRLQPVDEAGLLPAFPGVGRLLAAEVTRGRCELLPALSRPANAWHPGCIGVKGGVQWPHWDPDPTPPFRAVQLFRIRDAFYMPSYGVVISSGGDILKCSLEEAAFATPDLLALPHVRVLGGDKVLDLAGTQVPSLAQAAVTLPWGGIGNYAHFVLDCLTAAALIHETPELDGYPLVFPPLSGWQRRHLELASLPPLELGGPIYHVSDLVFTSCMAHFLGSPNVNYRTLRERQLGALAAPDVGSARIYVSRRGRDYRRFLSEGELEDRLRAAGFLVLLPEEHSVDEQMRVFRQAAVVVACTGAGLANVLYCRPDARVVEIKPVSSDGWWVPWICALVGLRWRPYFCDVDVDPAQASDGGFSFDADLEDLLRFVLAAD